jgi:Icc-related predicted phosphoesterase
VAVCGHIHESWGQESLVGGTRVVNLGPEGVVLEV